MMKNLSRPKRKKATVIPIDRTEPMKGDQPRVIASDAVTNRIIIAIGSQRFAYDQTTRITELPPTAGDEPAPVVPLRRPPTKKYGRDQGE